MNSPAIAIRFLDFPTFVMKARVQGGKLALNTGKKCSFKMHSDDLQGLLLTKPAYVMLVDADPTSTKIIASCTINLKQFA